VVTNPPYGIRLSKTKDLRNLYAQFGNILRARCPGWDVTIICDRLQLVQSTGLPFGQGKPVMNGGLRVNLVKCRV
jgi:putative N6-adenine-specific DNA methylase